jgi:galactokinase
MDPVARALLCQKAEHDYAGVPCGIMDQLAVGATRGGHALMIDCRDLALTQVPMPEGIAMVVADTRVKHALGGGEYAKRRADCEAACKVLGVPSLREATLDQVEAGREDLGDRLFRRARHAVTEMVRVGTFAEALRKSDAAVIGRTMRDCHESLRDDYEVSCQELDALVDAAYEFGPERGLLGARMTGGGFGGSTINLVREEGASDLCEHLASAFQERFGAEIEPFVTSAAGGARILG